MEEILTSRELVDRFIALTKSKHEHPELYRGWPIGIELFDKITGGIGRGWYVVIAGQRKAGKTSMLTTITRSFGNQGVGFLRVSLEENNMQIAERLVSNVASIDRTRFRDVILTPDDFEEMEKAGNEIGRYGGTYSYGISTVSHLNEVINVVEPEVVILDYVQLMSEPGALSRTMEISSISRELKKMTLRDPPLTVIAAAQLNDQGEYLWSRDLGRDADLAIKLTRVKDEYGKDIDHKLKLEIADSRHSDTGDFEVAFNGARSLVGTLSKIDIRGLI